MTICNKITLFLIKREIISNSDIDIFNYGIFVILYNMFLIFNILIIGLFFYKFSFARLVADLKLSRFAKLHAR